ncbi:MAG: hypothetical protein JJ975_14050 [Bacteroidia bacterium]|nr:hypothetical protein [Bacteroidia bacterium]
MEEKSNFQSRFVNYVKRNVPQNINLAHELADLLEVSKDSAYRRLRNSTPITIDEAMVICDRFNLNLSYFFSSKYQIVPFSFNKLLSGDGGLISYLIGMKSVIEEGLAKEARVIFAAEDIPVFHHFEYPKLAGFKLFYWQKAVMNEAFLTGQKYRVDLLHPDVLNASLELAEAYNKIESVEIWTEESINATLRQILYFVESGQFEDLDYALAVLADMELMIANLQKKAERSSKTMDDNKNFVLYNSEVRIGNNCILIEKEDGRVVYISHNTFNSIRTESRDFCDETALWMENLIRKSTSINDVSEKHRFQFFKVQFNKIEEVRRKIAEQQ